MSNSEQHLLSLFKDLPAAEQANVIAFAEFLRSRSGDARPLAMAAEPVAIPEPEPIERPAHESVVKAVKRLARTYPMLDKSKILNETSALVTQHVMHGRDATEVIDELEVVFRRFYDELKAGHSG